MPDQQTVVNALIKGEIDMIESPQHDLFKVMEADPNIKLENLNKWGNQYIFRFNQLFQPFDNAEDPPSACITAFNQKDFLDGVIGDPSYYKVCKAMFMCDTPYATTKGMEARYDSNFAKAKELLKEGGLRRHAGRSDAFHRPARCSPNLAPVAKSLMERAGLKVDMVSMDWTDAWSRRRARKGPAGQGRLERLPDLVGGRRHRRSAGQHLHQRRGENAWFGWPKDDELLKLRAAFADESDPDQA